MSKTPTVGFVSLGCPKATVDSERILTQLRMEGYQIVPSYEDADVVVVNTCGFIDSAKAESLDAIGEALMTEMPDSIINVEGHTDSDGTDEYNQNLSEQRAWSVKSYLVQKFGLDPNRLIIVGYGERAPIADNATEQGKARNRRVEFENVTDLYAAQVVETAAP